MLALDAPQYIDRAIGSINQNGPIRIEHIVVHDGDGSFINNFRQRYPNVCVINGAGAGATNAAIRAIEAATGDFILFLHSDDRLGAEALTRLAASAAERPEVKIWTGNARIFRTLDDGREITVRRLAEHDSTRLSIENVCDDIPLLTARFCHRSLYSELGNFDPDFAESSDREFLLRAVMAGVVEAPLDVLVSELRLHEASKTIHSKQEWLPPYLAEHVRLADRWLARPHNSAVTRAFLKNWRARESLRLCIYQCRVGQWRAALLTLLRAKMADPLWPFRIFTTFAARRRRARNDHPVETVSATSSLKSSKLND